MTRLTNLTPAEKKFIDDAIAAAERAAGKKLNQVTSARAAPLIADFGGLVVLTLRNHLRFTRVHSHAVAQKSSGAFSGMRVRKCAGNGSDAPELR